MKRQWTSLLFIIMFFSGCTGVELAATGFTAAIGLLSSNSSHLPQPKSVKPQYTANEQWRRNGIIAYKNFEYCKAIKWLKQYLEQPSAPPSNRLEVRAFLAASLFLIRDRQAADQQFQRILMEDRNYIFDSSIFRPDIIKHFENVKR